MKALVIISLVIVYFTVELMGQNLLLYQGNRMTKEIKPGKKVTLIVDSGIVEFINCIFLTPPCL